MAFIGNDDYAIFTINGKVYKVNSSTVQADTSLNTFIRDHANLKGTKYMCKEGGCGACIVTVQSTHPVTKEEEFYAVNSCLISVLSCHGRAITTIEGIGNKKNGYHKLQIALAKFNGTQCGFCSPAMVMNMYSLLKENPVITMREIENSFGGNICRCTGYRPILDAFKSFASDAPAELKQKCQDIEDLMKGCKLNKTNCKNTCTECKKKHNGHLQIQDNEHYDTNFIELALASKNLEIRLSETSQWFRVSTVSEITQIFDLIKLNTYMLVAGNTAKGVYWPKKSPAFYIDISNVAELKKYQDFNDRLELGANMTLTECIKLFQKLSKERPLLFGYTGVLAEHLDLVANVPVRNVGTLAGNLSIKHEHNEFPSDIFLILLTVGARIQIHNQTGIADSISLLEYLKMDMYKKIITKIILPTLSSDHYHLKTFKIMPRKQNVHALVNAGFLFRINHNKDYLIEEKPVIVYGNINNTFTTANKTESYLTNKNIMHQEVLTNALNILNTELIPERYPAEASPEYRKKLAMSLFYRYVLSVNPDIVNKRYRSGYSNLQRPLSSGKQDIVTNKEEWPLTEPIQKLEGLLQCAGEAEYINDRNKHPSELYGAFVLAEKANATFQIDATPALNIPGVVAFYSAKDIPGKNSFIQPETSMDQEPEYEEIFCSGKTLYSGQPVGIIVAETQELASKASHAVKITYFTTEKPLLTIEQVLESGDKSRIKLDATLDPTQTKTDIQHVIKGEFRLEGQYHFTMETQTCLCVPTDLGMNVYPSTQWPASIQTAVALALNIPNNSVHVEVKRVGGAFGCKVSRSSLIATAAAVASYNLNVPVRLVLDLQTNMKAIGKRYPMLAKYDVGVNNLGEIQYLKLDMYENYGDSGNDIVAPYSRDGLYNFYDVSTWKANVYAVKTDLPCNIWARAPGTTEAISTVEHILDHISFVTKQDPIDVRKVNCSADDRPILDEMFNTIITSSDYTNRLKLAETFNNENRWKKRGISILPMKYDIAYFPNYHALVSIFAGDGTVGITSGGIEMGQGLNTKVVQVCAYALGIDISMIKMNPTMSITAPNNMVISSSVGSEAISLATLKCCETLLERLKPIREAMDNPTWVQVVQAAVNQGVDLSAQYMFNAKEPKIQTYPVYGVVVTGMEVDLLTGQYQILRTDLLEDAGESLSPSIDVGQIEGAFVMGLGYFHSEELIYDKSDGTLLTNRTWTYWPPGALDIPADFRITLRKNAPNPVGVLRSKATGEPALCLAVSILHSVRIALQSALKDEGKPDEWININQPCTFEKVLLAAGTEPEDFML